LLAETVEFVKGRPGPAYRDLHARRLVDMAIYLVVAALFCDHATAGEKKLAVAKYWLAWRVPEIHMLAEQIKSADQSAVDAFDTLAGPVPVVE